MDVVNELGAVWHFAADGQLANDAGSLCVDVVAGSPALHSCDTAGAKWRTTDGNQLQTLDGQACVAAVGSVGARNVAQLASATASSNAGALHG